MTFLSYTDWSNFSVASIDAEKTFKGLGPGSPPTWALCKKVGIQVSKIIVSKIEVFCSGMNYFRVLVTRCQRSSYLFFTLLLAKFGVLS